MAFDLNYQTVQRNPSADEFQAVLRPVKRVLELCQESFPKPKAARAWLNTPHSDLGQAALETIFAKNSEAVLIILENAALAFTGKRS